MEHKVATPQIVLNYASMLEERKYFEESFKVYERGVDMFRWPHVREIWAAYLTKFVARYGGMKIERARDLFEQCVDGIPAEEAKTFYLLYAKLEEEHGLIRHAMSDKFEMYVRYIRKVEDNFGITKTRPIYEKAIEDLPDDQVKDMCLRFAAMERKLGEIDRARAILAHAAQF
ncbi:SYF1, partial [Symbiodinium sp. KB8]